MIILILSWGVFIPKRCPLIRVRIYLNLAALERNLFISTPGPFNSGGDSVQDGGGGCHYGIIVL